MMGVFDFLRGKPRRILIKADEATTNGSGRRAKPPRKRRTALEVAIDRRILQLQTEQPALFDKVALRRAGLVTEEDGDEIERAFAIVERAQRMGKKLRGAKDEEEEPTGWAAVAREFGKGAGGVLVAAAKQNGALPLPPAAPDAPALPPGRTGTATGGAASAELERQIAELIQMTPAQAADWLRSQNNATANQVIAALVNTPDAQIPQLIEQIRAVAPRGAGLLAGRADWLVAVAQRLRQARYNQENPTVSDSGPL